MTPAPVVRICLGGSSAKFELLNGMGFCVLRSLDLTGPLLLGGVPKLPEDFPIQNHQFVGCMKNLRIDNRHIDMASFIANNGTLPGKLHYNLLFDASLKGPIRNF